MLARARWRWVCLCAHARVDERAKPPNRHLVRVEHEVAHRCRVAVYAPIVAAIERAAGNWSCVTAVLLYIDTTDRAQTHATRRRSGRRIDLWSSVAQHDTI